MEFLLVTVGVFLTFIGGIFGGVFINDRDISNEKPFFRSLIFIIIGFICCAVAVEYVRDIKPIEVYRGNTTLKITYQDDVAVDSVVVYKNKQ